MATVNGVNYTKQLDPNPDNILERATLRGKLRAFNDTYECADLATEGVIQVGFALPTGAIVHDVIIGCDDLGVGNTLSVGDEGSATRYINAKTGSEAAVHLAPEAVAGMAHTVAGTTDSIIRITVGGTSLATGSIAVTVFFAEE